MSTRLTGVLTGPGWRSSGAPLRYRLLELLSGSDLLRNARAHLRAAGAVLALSAWVLLCYSAASNRAAQITDADITSNIRAELVMDESAPASAVHVETLRGIVTATGTVDNLLARERVASLAASTRGVRAIINNIDVKPAPRTDDAIRDDIYAALVDDPSAYRYDIEANVLSGTAVLTGHVQSYAEKELAGELVKGVRGIKFLINEVEVSQGITPSDRDLWRAIHQRLALDARLRDCRIDLTVDNGQVTLIGTVGSIAQRSQAAALVWLPGVQAVDVSNLRVAWDNRREADDPLRPHVSDVTIKAAIQDALFYDPRVLSFNIYPRVNGGVVLLSGNVDNYRAKMAAEDDAKNTVGVWLVKNSIRVRPSMAPIDQDLQRRVRKAFARDPYLEPTDISVSTIEGVAYIEGIVNSAYSRERVAEVAATIRAVTGVVNKVSWDQSRERIQDWTLQNRIEAQMVWSPYVQAEEIKVQVSKGVVTLSGETDNWFERQEAELIALEGGATDVRNHIVIRSSSGQRALQAST